MSVFRQEMQDLTVTVQSVVLHLEEYQIVGGCSVREQGTAAGNCAVTAFWPKGTRLTLKGRLSPELDAAQAEAACDALMRAGTESTVNVGHLRVYRARLTGFSFAEREGVTSAVLVFLTETAVEVAE